MLVPLIFGIIGLTLGLGILALALRWYRDECRAADWWNDRR